MMRLWVTKVTPNLHAAGATVQTLRGVNRPLVDAINNALVVATASGAAYNRWFGGFAANRAVVLANLQMMAAFANANATVTLSIKDASVVGAGSNAYAWPQGPRAWDGQYILNLGSGFGLPFAGVHVALAHATIQGQALQTIAHELSHLVFGANINVPNPLYENEPYLDDALTLAGTDPVWASYNADNYGYFIEACS